jgi:hypothetical protein
MPLQLIFTSARPGRVPGRSGFCTVARHRTMPDRLAQLLEGLGTPHERAEGATFTFRVLEAAGQHWFVLSRFVARGLDYTQRDNRLAHHLAFTQEEAALLPPPAALAYRWSAWRDTWSDEPSWLEGETKPLVLKPGPALTPAATWRQTTGTGAKAAWLVSPTGPVDVALLNAPDTETTLRLLAEAAVLLGKGGWMATYTTDVGVTGADGFRWCIGPAAGRVSIDLATAAKAAAPTGDLARQAAMGVPAAANAGAGARPAPTPKTRTAKADDEASPSWGLITVVSLVVALAGYLGFKVLQTPSPEKAPATTAVETPPPPIDTAKANDLFKANLALKDIDGLIDREEFVEAANLWLETAALSPEFAAKHSSRILPRLTARFSTLAATRFAARLDALAPKADGKESAALAAELQDTLKVGAKLGVEKDPAWRELEGVAARAALIASLDVRPTLLIPGVWKTGDTGPAAPSQATFELPVAAATTITQFLKSAGVGPNNTVNMELRLLPLASLHARESKVRPTMGELRRARQGLLVEARAIPGQMKRPIYLDVGGNVSNIELNFLDGAARGFPETNRLLELTLPNGERLALALIADPQALKPLDLGLGALRKEADTGVVRAAPWAERAVQDLAWAGGTPGLYPSGHPFPDRDLPSIRATRSLLETDLIQLERKSGPGTPSSLLLAERRRLFNAGDLIRAGAPWSLTIVNPRGEELITLLEFR